MANITKLLESGKDGTASIKSNRTDVVVRKLGSVVLVLGFSALSGKLFQIFFDGDLIEAVENEDGFFLDDNQNQIRIPENGWKIDLEE